MTIKVMSSQNVHVFYLVRRYEVCDREIDASINLFKKNPGKGEDLEVIRRIKDSC